jgi:hypothetical protein
MKGLKFLAALTAMTTMSLARPQMGPRMVVDGTVTQVVGNSFDLRTSIGGHYTVQITPRTVISIPRVPNGRGRVMVGDRVTVNGISRRQTIYAATIVIHRRPVVQPRIVIKRRRHGYGRRKASIPRLNDRLVISPAME